MKRQRRTPERIVRKLGEADADLAAGTADEAIRKKLDVAPNAFYRRQSRYRALPWSLPSARSTTRVV